MRSLVARIRSWWLRFSDRLQRPRGLIYVDSDELPDVLPARDLAVAREDDELWMAGLRCPCGCGKRLEMMLLPGVKPRWDLSVDNRGRPSLRPSVWAATGCRSHFWLRHGRIEWCD